MTKKKEYVLPALTEEEYLVFVKGREDIEERANYIARFWAAGQTRKRYNSEREIYIEGIDRFTAEGVYFYENGITYGDGYQERFEYLMPVDCLLHPEKYYDTWKETEREIKERRAEEVKEHRKNQYLALKKEFGDG